MVGVLEEGVLVQFGSPEDVYNHPATPFVARFTGLAGVLARHRATRGDEVGIRLDPEGCHLFRADADPAAKAAAAEGDPADAEQLSRA